jgi:hypothetical protein
MSHLPTPCRRWERHNAIAVTNRMRPSDDKPGLVDVTWRRARPRRPRHLPEAACRQGGSVTRQMLYLPLFQSAPWSSPASDRRSLEKYSVPESGDRRASASDPLLLMTSPGCLGALQVDPDARQ